MSKPRLIRDSIIYAASSIATKAIGVLMLPILTRLLTPAQYGIIDLIALFTLVGLEIAMFGSQYGVALHYFDGTSRPQLVGTFLIGRLIYSSILAVIGIISADWQAALLKVPTASTAIALAWATLPASTIISVWLNVMRQEGHAGRLALISLVRVIVAAGLVIGLLFRVPDALAAYCGALLIVDLGSAIGLSVLYRRWIGKPTWATFKQLQRQGMTVFIHLNYFLIITLLGRQILVYFSSPAQQGFYAVAVKISYISWILISAVTQTWLPYSLAIAHEPEAAQRYGSGLSAYVLLVGSCTIGLGLFAPEMITLLAQPEYLQAAPTVGWLALSLMAQGAVTIVTTGLNILKQTVILGITSGVMCGVNLGLGLILVPRFGGLGLALTMALSQGVSVIALYWLAQRRYPLPFQGRHIAVWLGGILALIGLATVLPATITWTIVGIKIAAFGGWILFVWLTGGRTILWQGLGARLQRLRPAVER